jgi:hypothetical protein
MYLHRSINWMDTTERTLQALFPEYKSASRRLTERLGALLLERLPHGLSRALLELLPFQTGFDPQSEEGGGNTSIGYTDFIEKTEQALGSSGLDVSPETAREIADAFLWAVVHEIPSEMKHDLTHTLPLELRARMDLYSASSDEAKVA